MSAEIKCDKCNKYFGFDETYCPDCVTELETANNDLQKEVENLKDQAGDLEDTIVTLKERLGE